jgi:hypothetical protein
MFSELFTTTLYPFIVITTYFSSFVYHTR